MSSPPPSTYHYQAHRHSQSQSYIPTSISISASASASTAAPSSAPAPPPKPSSQEVSRRSTPAGCLTPSHPPPPQQLHTASGSGKALESLQLVQEHSRPPPAGPVELLQDPGDQWLPKILEEKSKQDLTTVLARPELLAALAHSTTTAHPSITASQEPLQTALASNISLASHLNEVEAHLAHLRSSAQAQLLSTHQLERQWKQKQSDMDRALAPFSPSSLYQRLNQGVQEQEMVCRALEESFLDGDGGIATEREIAEWVRRYREAKKVYYFRQERKERWDEGRVGGWR